MMDDDISTRRHSLDAVLAAASATLNKSLPDKLNVAAAMLAAQAARPRTTHSNAATDVTTGSGVWSPIKGCDDLSRSLRDEGAFLPAPLPSDVRLRSSTFRLLADAQEALGRLDEAADRLPDRAALVRSSQLRDLQTITANAGIETLLMILTLDIPETTAPTVDATLNRYLNADDAAVEAVGAGDPIDITLLNKFSATLTGDNRAADDVRWRTEPCWLGGPEPQDAYLIAAPPGPNLQEATEQWAQWVNSQLEIPLIAKVALGHFQLAVLAPFPDANHLARLYVTLELIQAGVLRDQILPLSSWLNRHADDYRARLRGVIDDGNLDAWMSFIATGIRATCQHQIQLITKLEQVRDEQLSKFRREDTLQQVVSGLTGQPVTTPRHIANLHDISTQVAQELAARLHQAGLIQPLRNTGYPRLFICSHILRVFDPHRPIARDLDVLPC